MKLASLKRFLKSRENRNPRLVGMLKRFARRFNGSRASYPRLMGREVEAVADVLHTPNWNMNYGGDLAHVRLEEEFAGYIGTRYAVAVNTGGMAIQMALRAFGLKPGDEVVHQVDTCVASAFAVMAAGATPIFADINKDDFMLAPTSAEDQVSSQTRVIMPVHMWGNPENMDWITTLAKKHNLYVLEDACLSLGAEWKGRRTGSNSYAGVFSFGCLKPIQAGEGGMIVTDDEALARELRVIRNWGDTTTEYGVRDQRTLSWNGRISEIVAAVALEQLRGYPKHFSRLQEYVAIFVDRLNSIDGIDIAVEPSAQRKPAYTQIVVKLDGKALGLSKTELMKRLTAAGVGVWHANFEPINTLSFFTQGKWQDWVLRGDLNRVERNYNHKFINSQEVYESLGMGFVKDNFLSRNRVRSLIKELELALVRQK